MKAFILKVILNTSKYNNIDQTTSSRGWGRAGHVTNERKKEKNINGMAFKTSLQKYITLTFTKHDTVSRIYSLTLDFDVCGLVMHN